MSVILILILTSLLVACGFLAAFIWAVKTGQFDDRFTPSVRILFDNENKRQLNIKIKKNINEISE